MSSREEYDAETAHVRDLIYRNDLFGQLLTMPGGRDVLLAQRRKGLSVLAEPERWASNDLAYAQWAVHRIGECLAMLAKERIRVRKRAEAKKRAASKKDADKALIQFLAHLGCDLLWRHAWGDEAEAHHITARGDFREAFLKFRTIFEKAGGKVPKERKE